ncbi:MAG: SH3 domain-containing protein [Oscillospiraceae bacterium]|jgi:uncharacterized protein YgiM (DUF1202 family)|nr:SH3 domain-containing protein [Oscillospiraceae bacterium]
MPKKWKARRIGGIFAILALILCFAAAVPAQAASADTVTVNTRSLNIRQQPSAYSQAIGTVFRGDRFPLQNYNISNGFYQISYKGRTGYISARFVSPYQSYQQTQPSQQYQQMQPYYRQTYAGGTIRVIGTSVNVRSQSNTSSAIVGTANCGQTFTLLSGCPVNGFYSIKYCGGAGFISAKYVCCCSF